MAGKRLLDLAALFNASRGAARKHAALRSQQLDVWSQTSSIAKAWKSQADRVTEIAKATSIVASYLSNSSGKWSSGAPESSEKGSLTQRKQTNAKQRPSPKLRSEQKHPSKRIEPNESPDVQHTVELEVQQEKLNSCPLPDNRVSDLDSNITISKQYPDPVSNRGAPLSRDALLENENGDNVPRPSYSKKLIKPFTSKIPRTPSSNQARMLQRQYEQQIPSLPTDADNGLSGNKLAQDHDEDIFYEPSQHASPVLSSLPRMKIPRQTENTQNNDVHVQNVGLNSDCYSSATVENAVPAIQAVPEQEQVPEGINTDLFYSPRVSRMLGNRTQTGPNTTLDINAPDKISQPTIRPSGINADTFPDLGFAVEAQDQGTKRDEVVVEIHKVGDKKTVETPHTSSVMASLAAPYEMRESRIPSSRIGRLWNYGGLAAGMFGGAISESLRRATGNGGGGSYMLSAANMDRLVGKLSKMRGAALKLGQMMSFQDSKMLPVPIQEILLRVQDSADYMPPSQRNKVLASNLGSNWRDLFSTFEEKPIAAASIGQVHSAVLRSTGEKVAVKVQYPGVADSIDSDLGNLTVLLTASRLMPKGLYLEKTIANARTELAWECDYIREAECGQRFRDLLSDEKDIFVVPKIIPEASGKQVLTMEYMEGVGVTKVENLKQDQKDWIGTQILRLCLREITEFRFMQTDPNWTNFLYNEGTNKLELVDFGASRDYPEHFISHYTRLLLAASKSDKDEVRNLSVKLGYLTGHESKAMLDAHIASVLTLAEPFLASSAEAYDFRDQTITERVKALIPVMVRERLAPPPEETYSLHRKLSGAFLLCARLGSSVRCRDLFENSMKKAGLY